MSRTHNQQMADSHEADMADWINGRLSKSSGNQWSDPMDVRNGQRDVSLPLAGDGKSTCGKSMALSREGWEKARRQAGANLDAFMAHRWYEDYTLGRVALDLITVEKDFFVRMLQSARAWEDQQAALEEGLAQFEAGVKAYEAEQQAPTGCDCCR